jgi:FKBP-type peptidyl-prolyl cis-trans isomerase (trigger factor)
MIKELLNKLCKEKNLILSEEELQEILRILRRQTTDVESSRDERKLDRDLRNAIKEIQTNRAAAQTTLDKVSNVNKSNKGENGRKFGRRENC